MVSHTQNDMLRRIESLENNYKVQGNDIENLKTSSSSLEFSKLYLEKQEWLFEKNRMEARLESCEGIIKDLLKEIVQLNKITHALESRLDAQRQTIHILFKVGLSYENIVFNQKSTKRPF